MELQLFFTPFLRVLLLYALVVVAPVGCLNIRFCFSALVIPSRHRKECLQLVKRRLQAWQIMRSMQLLQLHIFSRFFVRMNAEISAITRAAVMKFGM